tara:strand:- start:491 stop:817 length:327 start_codon:yes stop_codon:yes gene_type:complete
MTTNSYKGYNPFYPTNAGGGAMYVTNNDANNCYGYLTGHKTGIFPDGTKYKEDADALRQYILSLESIRKLQDLVDVQFSRGVKKGDFLVYDNTIGKWVLTNFLSGGEF